MNGDGPRAIRVFGEASSEATGTTNPLVKALERLNPAQKQFVLDLAEFEVDEGYPLTQCVNAVREVLVRGGTLTLQSAPEILVNGLEQAGLLLPPAAVHILSTRAAPG